MTDVDLMLRFLVQLLVVLGCCRAIGWLGKRFLGQTQVVMEMVAGVCLGPSLLGTFFPEVQNWIFPSAKIGEIAGVAVRHPSMAVLYVVAQLGLVLYMFVVGLEFDFAILNRRAKGAASISIAGIVAPFALGALLAYGLQGRTDLFAPEVGLGEAALYLGASMCITAFPMLARILYERGIARTEMGVLALGAGAVDDAAAWAILSVVLASLKHEIRFAIFAIGGGALFAVSVLTLGRRALRRFEKVAEPSQTMFGLVLLMLFAGAWITDALGIYAVFGAFIMGAAMPKGAFAEALQRKIEPITVGVLLPFFFVYSGLNTRLGLLDTPALWGICALACLAAMVGKFGGCALAARATGESWRASVGIGTLMNARGLMELIILNIGLQQGVITPTLFTMLTLMAILTTLMASPIFNLLYPLRKDALLGTPAIISA
ncbi:cation:proton antiporter [bacterium]|nr:MAG: cation:proton antiporter [bacterium]